MNKLSCLIVSLFCILNLTQAQSNSSGPNSPIVVGHITAVNGNELTIKTKKLVRKVVMTEKTAITYISLPENLRTIKVGYEIKGKANDGVLRALQVSAPVKVVSELSKEQLKMTPSQIFAQTDKNKDGSVCYGEFSAHIHYSGKHGPDKFLKSDKNKDGFLNLDEFTDRLSSVTSWKMSRKSPQAWFEEADKDKDGFLNLTEYTSVSTGKNHAENTFKKKDSDKSGKLSLDEWLKSSKK